MAVREKVAVGFLVHDGIWLGGLNYLSNLLAAVRLLPEAGLAPVLLTGTRPNCLDQHFAGLPVLRTPLLDRKSLPWIARKANAAVFAQDRLLQRFMARNGISVLSHSGHLGRFGSIPTIGWIPDLQHMRLPDFFTTRQIRERDRGYIALCRRCTRVVVSSRAALADLEEFSPGSREKADVLSFVAIPPVQDGRHCLSEMQQTYHFNTPYFLLPNQFWAHKNHRVVIEALALLKQRGRPVLVLATGQTRDLRNPTHFCALMRRAEAADVLDCFRVLGNIPFRHLAVLMEHAIALVNPSMFEGWSTSVEEAKSMGKQILLSDIAVHQEQAPPRGVYFHPDDADGLAAILDIAREGFDPTRDKELQQQAQLQLPARLQVFAHRYIQVVSRTLAAAC